MNVVRLQNLALTAGAKDIRVLFKNLKIPDGGVIIVGRENGEAFIVFSTAADAKRAIRLDGKQWIGATIRLFLSSREEMQKAIDDVYESLKPIIQTNRKRTRSDNHSKANLAVAAATVTQQTPQQQVQQLKQKVKQLQLERGSKQPPMTAATAMKTSPSERDDSEDSISNRSLSVRSKPSSRRQNKPPITAASAMNTSPSERDDAGDSISNRSRSKRSKPSSRRQKVC